MLQMGQLTVRNGVIAEVNTIWRVKIQGQIKELSTWGMRHNGE